MVSLDSPVFKKKNVPWRIIEEEALLVDVDKGEVIYLNEIGASIWGKIDPEGGAKTSVNDIVDHICSEYTVKRPEAETDVVEFLENLAKKGVISY